MLLRPLNWFDRVDPRDPLQITAGVDAALIRAYFPNDANLWLWAVLAESEPKGWEVAPTVGDSGEFGGRLQWPAGDGEIAVYLPLSYQIGGLPLCLATAGAMAAASWLASG